MAKKYSDGVLEQLRAHLCGNAGRMRTEWVETPMSYECRAYANVEDGRVMFAMPAVDDDAMHVVIDSPGFGDAEYFYLSKDDFENNFPNERANSSHRAASAAAAIIDSMPKIKKLKLATEEDRAAAIAAITAIIAAALDAY